MTVLKYDDVIKKLMYFERSYQYHTHAKFHSQGLTGSGFMTEVLFAP